MAVALRPNAMALPWICSQGLPLELSLFASHSADQRSLKKAQLNPGMA
jgi:hypothetical protein